MTDAKRDAQAEIAALRVECDSVEQRLIECAGRAAMWEQKYDVAGRENAALRAERDEARALLAAARSYIPLSGLVDHADLRADIAKALGEKKP